MLKLIAKRVFQMVSTIGADTVLFGITLPSDTVVQGVRGRISLQGETRHLHTFSSTYAVEGYVLPLLDPDAGQGFENLWDTLVPKQTDVQAMDLDTAAADTTPFYEPGEADWTALLDLGLRPRRVFHRHRMLDFNSPMSFRFLDTETPFNTLFHACDAFNVNIRQRMRVKQPSALVFAVTSPNLDDTTATVESALAEQELGQIKYLEHVLERALLGLFGVFEGGAETPWEEASLLLQRHLLPDVFEATATRMSVTIFNVYGEVTIEHMVVGRLGKQTVNLEY